jgi:hypothetical protein
MKNYVSVLVIVLLLSVISAAAVFADAKGPNSGEFGPAWCEDGSMAEVIVHVGRSFTGQYPDSTRVGIAFSEYLVDDNGNIVEEWLYTPGNRPTTRCRWIVPGLEPGWYVEGDVLLTPDDQ